MERVGWSVLSIGLVLVGCRGEARKRDRCDDVVDAWIGASVYPDNAAGRQRARAECDAVVAAGAPAPDSPDVDRWIAVDCATKPRTPYTACLFNAKAELEVYRRASNDLAALHAWLDRPDDLISPCDDLQRDVDAGAGFETISSWVPASAIRALHDAVDGPLCLRDSWIRDAATYERAQDCTAAWASLDQIGAANRGDPEVTAAKSAFAQACPVEAAIAQRAPTGVPPTSSQSVSSLAGFVTVTVPQGFHCHAQGKYAVVCQPTMGDHALSVGLSGVDGGMTDLAKLTAAFERGSAKVMSDYQRTGPPQPATCAGTHAGLEVRGAFTRLDESFRSRWCAFLQDGHAFWVGFSKRNDDDLESERDALSLIAAAQYR